VAETTVGVLHPGAMGASVVSALAGNGHQVFWCDAARSAATRKRADAAGAIGCATLTELVQRSAILISCCPPEFASATADTAAACGFKGLYVDANAIAPARAGEIASRFPGAFVDGGIIGPPAWQAGTTRIYLSGERAQEAADVFAGSPLEAIVLPHSETAASAVKMCYAAWTKGNSALLLSVRALAEALSVGDALESEWQLSQPGTQERAKATAGAVAPKAWRFVAEMREIEATYASVNLPTGFHNGAAEFYSELAGFKDKTGVKLADLLVALESNSD